MSEKCTVSRRGKAVLFLTLGVLVLVGVGYTRRHDAESDLIYFRNRYYSPERGRFINRDPSGYVDGLNLYNAYFVPNGLDPYGLWTLVSTGDAATDKYLKEIMHDGAQKVRDAMKDPAKLKRMKSLLKCKCKSDFEFKQLVLNRFRHGTFPTVAVNDKAEQMMVDEFKDDVPLEIAKKLADRYISWRGAWIEKGKRYTWTDEFTKKVYEAYSDKSFAVLSFDLKAKASIKELFVHEVAHGIERRCTKPGYPPYGWTDEDDIEAFLKLVGVK